MRCMALPRVLVLSSLLLGCGAVPIDAVAPPPVDFADGLIAHWTFDHGSGDVVTDASGNGLDGQLTGGAWISDGRFAGGLRLRAGDVVAVPGFPAARPGWTVSAWIRMSPAQLAANSDMWATIVSTENLASGGWELNMDHAMSQPRFVFSFWSAPKAGYVMTQCQCVTTDTWIHLAAVVDDSLDRVSLFHNGTPVDQQPRPSDIVPGDSTLYFGRWSASGRLLNGDIDDIAVWGRALTATEIASLTAKSP